MRALVPLIVILATFITASPTGAAVTVTGKFSDASLLAAGTPSYRLALGNAYAVGDYVVVEVVQNTHAVPGLVTDSLGNTYNPLDGATGYNSAAETPLPLGFGLYGSLITVGGSRPTLHFNLGATGMVGVRAYTGESTALGLHNRPIAVSNGGIGASTKSPYYGGVTAFETGDLIATSIVALSPTVTFTPGPLTSAGWTQLTNTSGNGITLQLLEQTPATPDYYAYEWDTSPDVTVVVTSYSIRHA